MSSSSRWSIVSLLVAAILLGLASPASAANFTVDDQADAPDTTTGDGQCRTAAGDCTLRAAVQEANALAGPDAINLPAGIYALTIQGAGEDLAATGDLDMTDELTLTGTGSPTVNARSLGDDRAFDVLVDTEAVIDGIVVTGGVAFGINGPDEAAGGGILNQGSLILRRSRVTSNAALIGGGVGNFGRLGLDRTTIGGAGGGLMDPDFDGNVANFGAGVGGFPGDQEEESLTLVDRSTISGNVAVPIFVPIVFGGGVFSVGPLALRNSTVSGNDASPTSPTGPAGGPPILTVGGGLASDGPLELINVTLNRNAAEEGANVLTALNGPLATASTAQGRRLVRRLRGAIDAAGEVEPSTSAVNSIVANAQRGPNCAGTLTSEGHNLEFDTDTPPSCGFTQPSDVVGQNPLLRALTDNGGPTATHALRFGSPAIDAGDNADCPPTDQRGEPRADGDGDGSVVCDIGAFEAAAPPADLDLIVTAPGSVPEGQRFSYTSAVRNDGPGGAPGTVLRVRLSPGQRFVTASAGCTYAAASRTVTCDLDVIGEGATRRVGITVEATEPGTVSADARVTSDAPDPDPANNRAVERVSVRGTGPAACTLEGTPANDVLVGTSADEVICGGGGNDVVVGRGGDDQVRGGGGNDVLRGDEGDDVLTGGEGNDTLNGGPGADRLSGQAGSDSLAGSDGVSGNDSVDGGAGRDACGRDPGDTRTACP